MWRLPWHATRTSGSKTRRLAHRRGCRIELLEDRIALTTLPAGFVESTLAGGLSQPTSMALAPDGRIFVTEQTGNVRVIRNGSLLATPFLTLSVNSTGERGLLGLALDPNFAGNGFVYVYYTTSTAPIHNRVSRFTASGDTAVAGSETPLLDLETLSATNHNGGALHFGNDGKLYIAVGENAVPSNSQTLANRLGKVLRINSDGTIPTDNPFFNTASGLNRSIWALGLRNPFTFAIQPGSGRIYINDVGQSTWEEINAGAAGANYGWPATEGPTTNPAFSSPLFAYRNGSGVNEGCAIAGGAFYNPFTRTFPVDYLGDYFFADLCGSFIRRYDPAAGAVSDFASATPFGTVDIDIAADGSLLYLSRGANAVLRIQFTANGPPLIVGADAGGEARVRVLEATTGVEQTSLLPYGTAFRGGVRVATGDVNQDGAPDIIAAPGPGTTPLVRIFDGATGAVLRDLMAYHPAFGGGVFVASGDFNGDGQADIVTAAGAGGGPHVRVFDGRTGGVLGEFFAYVANFTGGVQVAVADVDGAAGPEIITGAGPGGGPHVRIFRNAQGQEHPTLPGFFAYDPRFSGGVFVAAGNMAGDARAEIITGAGAGGGPHVRVFDQARAVVSEFFAYDPRFTGGVRVGAMDLNGDGQMELITAAGPGGGPHVRVLSIPSRTQLASYFAFNAGFAGGVFVAGSRARSSTPLVAGGPSADAALIDQAWEQHDAPLHGDELEEELLESLAAAAVSDAMDAAACSVCLHARGFENF